MKRILHTIKTLNHYVGSIMLAGFVAISILSVLSEDVAAHNIFAPTNLTVDAKEKDKNIILAQTLPQTVLELTIKNIQDLQGLLYFALYSQDHAKVFPSDPSKAFIKRIIKPVGRTIKVTIKTDKITMPKGLYAISLFQDLDNDKKVSTNFLGIPNEPLGISNDAKGSFGPPSFEDAAFNLSQGEYKKITINLYKISD